MKIAIVRYLDEHDLQSHPMLGLGYIKSFVEHHMPGIFEFEYIECIKTDLPDEYLHADLYAFTALSQDYEEVIKLARFIDSHTDAPLILGGSHISFLPGNLVPEFRCGVLGDGEFAFLMICKALLEDKTLGYKQLEKIPGLIFWNENKELKFSPPSRRIEDLNELPIPDRSFGGKRLQPHMLSSRGCPYTCAFCASTEYWKKFRAFSAQYIMEEILSVAETYPDCDFLPFWDDLFIAIRTRFRGVVDMLERTRLNQIFKFSCSVRADLVDRQLCEDLVRGNFKVVFFGLESASDRLLRWLKGGKTTVPIMQKALDLFKQYEILAAAPFIVGIPTETKEELKMTYDFVLRNMEEGKLVEASSNVMCPMPATQIWADCMKKNIVNENPDFRWSRMRYYSGWRNYLVNQQGGHADFKTWVKARKENDSFFIGTEYSQDEMYETMEIYESKIAEMGLSIAGNLDHGDL